MKRIKPILSIATLALLAGCSPPEPVDATITDEAGDQSSHDMVKTVVSGDGEALTFKVTLSESPVEDWGTSTGNVLVVFLDTDNDATTGKLGGAWKEIGGFEYQAWISICDGAGSRECPNVDEDSENGARTVLWAMSVAAGDEEREDAIIPGGRVSGPELTARLPYEYIGAEPGQSIRVWVIEAGEFSREPTDRSGEAVIITG